eukprot:GHVN01044476.1.p1 GENE.GHVN01044476.1~~GHVN01044476.1.p1  ORF type:complete len:290 (+),score=55.49 GHVN01044476.1:101-970(+)
MSRHSKNNTANSIFTHHERLMMKDVGTLKTRLSGDSLRQFEHCWLCLRPARKPVCTPNGFIYCRECIIVNFGHQKAEMADQMRRWESQEAARTRERVEEEGRLRREEITQFALMDQNPIQRKNVAQSSTTVSSSSSKRKFADMSKEEARERSFWVVENTPTAEPAKKMSKPSNRLVCPLSNKQIKLKELIEVKPELDNSKEGEEADLELRKWVCAVCKKVMAHQKCVLIKFSGDVMCQDCLSKTVMGRAGFYGSRRVDDEDVVHLISGGTGFAAHNKVEAEKYRATMQL